MAKQTKPSKRGQHGSRGHTNTGNQKTRIGAGKSSGMSHQKKMIGHGRMKGY